MKALLSRVKNILLHPASEWIAVGRERSSSRRVLFGYAAVVTFALFLAIALPDLLAVRRAGPEAGARRSAVCSALRPGLLWYTVNLINIVVIGSVLQALVPGLASTGDRMRGLKIAAYAGTPFWLAAALTPAPFAFFGWFALAALFYSFYLMHLAIVVMTGASRAKAAWYLIGALVVSAIMVGIVDSALIQAESCVVRRL